MKKVRYIIRREYAANVKRKSFVISTILVPVLMAAFFVVPVLFSAIEPAKAYRVDVVDQTGQMGKDFAVALPDTLKDGRPKYVVTVVDAPGDRFDAERTAHIARIQNGAADIVIAIPASVLGDGKASYITREERNMNVLDRFEKVLTDIVIRRRLAGEGLDYVRVKSLTTGVSLDMQQVTAAGGLEEKSFLQDYGVVFVFVMLLYSSLLSWGMTIAKSIVEEKGSRVIEVLLSAVSPRDLMLGKLIGVGLAGLTQLGTWAVVGAIFATYASMGAIGMLASFHIAPAVFVYLILFFILGFMLFSSLFMIVGAACSTDQDAQQLQGLITLPMIIPILCLMLLIQNPASPLAVVLSLIPLFTPMIMLARVILLQPPAWQILLSIALVLASIFLAISFAARIFRVGILMYGKRPSLRELMHWYRLAR
jgi:ABC-2 type transport system permease protein